MKLKGLALKSVFHPAEKSSSAQSEPFLVVLHGRGDSPEGFAGLPEVLNIPSLNYLFLQAPDDYYGGYSWYDLPPNQLPGILRSRKLLKQLFAEIMDQGVKPEQIYLMGFSQGCLMTLEFGSRFEKTLGGYIGLSGYVYDSGAILLECNAAVKNAHWLVTHGTRDDILPVSRTREQIKELIQGGFKIEYLEYKKGHTLDDAEELPMIRAWLNRRIEKL